MCIKNSRPDNGLHEERPKHVVANFMFMVPCIIIYSMK